MNMFFVATLVGLSLASSVIASDLCESVGLRCDSTEKIIQWCPVVGQAPQDILDCSPQYCQKLGDRVFTCANRNAFDAVFGNSGKPLQIVTPEHPKIQSLMAESNPLDNNLCESVGLRCDSTEKIIQWCPVVGQAPQDILDCSPQYCQKLGDRVFTCANRNFHDAVFGMSGEPLEIVTPDHPKIQSLMAESNPLDNNLCETVGLRCDSTEKIIQWCPVVGQAPQDILDCSPQYCQKLGDRVFTCANRNFLDSVFGINGKPLQIVTPEHPKIQNLMAESNPLDNNLCESVGLRCDSTEKIIQWCPVVGQAPQDILDCSPQYCQKLGDRVFTCANRNFFDAVFGMSGEPLEIVTPDHPKIQSLMAESNPLDNNLCETVGLRCDSTEKIIQWCPVVGQAPQDILDCSPQYCQKLGDRVFTCANRNFLDSVLGISGKPLQIVTPEHPKIQRLAMA